MGVLLLKRLQLFQVHSPGGSAGQRLTPFVNTLRNEIYDVMDMKWVGEGALWVGAIATRGRVVAFRRDGRRRAGASDRPFPRKRTMRRCQLQLHAQPNARDRAPTDVYGGPD